MAKSILSNWGTFVFSAGINFVLSPIVVRALGETQYGAWFLLSSVVGYLGLLDLGVRSAVTRYMARFYAAGDHSSANRLYSAAFRIFSVGGVLAILIASVMALVLDRVFKIPPELFHVARIVTVLSGVSVGLSLVSGVFGGVLIGLERFDYSNAIEIGVSAARAVAIVVALRSGYGLIALAVLQIAATLARALATVFYTRRLYPQLDIVPRTWDRESSRLIFGFGLTASLLHVTSSLMLYSDSLVIGAFLPIGMVTYFAIAGNLSEYARAVVSGISQTLTPRISALQAGGEDSALQSAVLTSARLASLVVLPIAATFMVRGSSFVGLWMGPEYAHLAGQVLLALSFTLVTIGGYQVVAAAMFGISKHGGLIPIFIGEAVANLILSILLVRAYGVIGTALGTMIPRLIVSAVIGPWYVRRTLGISLRTFWVSVFLKPILGILPFAAASYLVERAWAPHNIFVFFAQVAALLPIAAISAWFVCLQERERTALRRYLGRKRPALEQPKID
ncbi:MAG: oligosaccharide flippase family protein [bacterium]